MRLFVRWLFALGAILYVFGSAQAYWQSRLQVSIVTAGGTTTFDLLNKSVNVNLSPGDLIATGAAGAGNEANVRGIANHTSGKYYSEYGISVSTSSGFGVVNATFAIGGAGNFVGIDNNGIACYSNSIFLNNAGVGNGGTFSNPSVGSAAVDLDNGKFWCRVDAGGWNNDVIGNQNPATNTGGISITVLGAGAIYPVGQVTTTGAVITANFGGSAYAQTPPSGFGNW